MRHLHLGLMFGAFVGCQSSEPIFIPLPSFDPEARSLVVVVEGASELTAEALALDDWSHHFELPADARVVHFLVYRETLSAMGLGQGRLALASGTVCARRSLAAPLQRFVLDGIAESTQFEPASGLPSVVMGLEFEVPCPCSSFEYEPVDLGPIGHGRVLERHRDGFRMLTTRGLFELSSALEVVSSTMGVQAERFFSDEDGVSWVSASRGRLLRWLEGGALELVHQEMELGTLERVGPGPNPDELVILSRSGFYRWRGASFELVSATAERFGSNQISVLVRLPEGPVIAGLYRNHGLLLLRPGADLVEPIAWSSDLDPPEALAFIPEVGLLLSSRSNRVFLSTDEGFSWRALTAPDPGAQLPSASAFLPFEGGFIELGRGGLRQYAPASGYCRAFMLPEAPELRAGVFRSDGSFLVVGDVADETPGGPTPIFVVRPVARIRS